ncbi:DUF222 domain-containing protein [Spongisporangium articulatum]|uniref:DUF222 domain-containing protein n=1 Tax=Spongisporangium articulatum TaxID=3362603 RepID=A0ABW8AHS1_9ACTN
MAVLELPRAYPSTADEVREFTDWLVGAEPPTDDAGRLELIQTLEILKSAAAAVQVRATAEYAASVANPRKAAKEIARARHESPHQAARLVGVARCLAEEMPHTLAALTKGETSEFRSSVMVRETALLTRENRALVDSELGPRLAGLGNAAVAREAKKIGFRLEPGLAYKRAQAAQVERRVTIRPAPDCMTVLTAVLPVAEGVAVYAALTRAADTAAIDPEDGRGKGQVMADTLRERVLGSSEPVPVEVQLVITDTAMTGHSQEPAHVNGFGPIPAPLARQLADPPDEHATRWIRRLWAAPETGQLIQMESRNRIFPAGLRKFVIARDQYCVTPWCGAPIRQIDHVVAAAAGGRTCADNAQGLCQACNLAKET